jgi:hypothetical protein
MHNLTPRRETSPTRVWHRLRLTVVLFVLATVLGGCVIRVVYNQLDWLLLWYAEEYVDLTPVQERQARELIARALDWHRANQLPRYARLTRTLLDGSQGRAITPPFLAARYGEIVELWDEVLWRVSPDIASVLQTLTDQQVEELFASVAKKNRELAKEYSGISAEERRAKQDKAIVRAFLRFTGRLTPAQEALVRRRTVGFHDLTGDWLHRRTAWQQEFRRILAGRQSDPAFATRFTDLALNPNQFDSPRYRDLVHENQQRSFELVAAVLDTLSPAQSAQLRRNLTTYAGDFDALVRERPSGYPAESPR